MNDTLQFLGWNNLQVGFGEITPDRSQWSALALDWEPHDIRNCSYAEPQKRVGISAIDGSDNSQVLASLDCASGSTRFLLRMDYVLHHAFNSDGTQICYTVPSARQGTADLYVYSFDSGSSRLLLESALAQSTVPSWYPSDQAIVYHSPDARIEVLDLQSGQRETVTNGTSPAVSRDGKRIAFCRDDQVYVWDIDKRTEGLVPNRRRLRKRTLTNGVSWSADGKYLSFGATVGLAGKETAFYLAEISNRDIRKIDIAYLTGLSLIAGNSSDVSPTKERSDL